MDEVEQRKNAKEFVKIWSGRGNEKQETQQFWSDLLHRVYGITDFSQRVEFEKPVSIVHKSFIDVYVPETHVLIEQKSSDIDLLKRKRQSDGSELNAYEQAKRYGSQLPYSERPRWIITCNFRKFLLYDMDAVRPEEKPVEILLEDLPEKYNLLSFLLDASVKKITVEQQLSIKAGELVGKLYDLMLPQYKDPTNEESLKALNKFCVRIVFCLYAEDALLFGPKGSEFHDYLTSFLPENRRKALIALFRMLDTKEEDRDQYEDQALLAFPYVNGGLFASDIEIPRLTDEIMELVLVEMSEKLDWSYISPTIFGACFESTVNPETRRKGGMHYTSVENIHKVIDPLFLEDLQNEYERIVGDVKLSKPKRETALRQFQDRLANLRFLDPACGSGNFLTETFLSLRRLENKVIEQLQHGMMVLGFADPVKVSIGQFAGIEINDFAVTVARTALWIAESQMIKETEAIVNRTIEFFPLKTDAKIVEGNALRMDWNDVVDRNRLDYIMGNPPFVGKKYQNKSQKQDLIDVFGKDFKGVGTLDYVTGWFKKACMLMQGTTVETAFVSTNSICQGELVSLLWKDLFNYGIVIRFAYSTFRWDNDSMGKAHVHCVIVGFTANKFGYRNKYIFDNDGKRVIVSNISPYLTDSLTVFIESRRSPLCDVKLMTDGNVPIDGNFLKIEFDAYKEFVVKEPQALKWVKKLVGSEEFINKKDRYVLWLVDCPPNELRHMPMVMDRVNKCREFRLQSNRAGTLKLAETPTVFEDKRNPDTALIVPRVSSEKRKYVPMGFIGKDTIALNAVLMLPNADIYDFGVLTSNIHMTWMRAVAGRLKSDYRYSKDIVYNNFPWPIVTDQQRTNVERTAQAILDARALYPNASLADLYDDLTMPIELRKAHQANDRAVMEAYGMWGKVNGESDIVAWLFRMYEELTKFENK